MSNLKIGDWVTTNEFPSGTDGIICASVMRCKFGIPGKIDEFSKYGGVRVHGYLWPESALTSPDPEGVPAAPPVQASPLVQAGARRQYDLGEFTKAAMNGICASSPAWSGNMELGDFGSMAVRIARATINALQEAEKEVKP